MRHLCKFRLRKKSPRKFFKIHFSRTVEVLLKGQLGALLKYDFCENRYYEFPKKNNENFGPRHWLITQKVFLGSGTEKILFMPSERAPKMLSFGSNIRCIQSRGGVREQI